MDPGSLIGLEIGGGGGGEVGEAGTTYRTNKSHDHNSFN